MAKWSAAKKSLQARVSFLHSKVSLPLIHKKISLGILGLAALLVAPTTALAVHDLATSADITSSSESPSLTTLSVGSTPEETHLDSSSVPSNSASVNSSTTSGGNSSSSTSVTVNGQTIPVPPNGDVHKTIINNDGQTTVDVSNNNNSSNSYSSSSNVQINSNSSTFSSSYNDNSTFSSP